MSYKNRAVRRAGRIRYYLLNLLIWVIALTVLVPVLYMLLISFCKNVFSLEGILEPGNFTLRNYRDLFTKHTFTDWIKNSLLVSTGTMVLSVVLTAMGSYVFSKMKFIGSRILHRAILLLQIFPLTLSMVAIYQIFSYLRLINRLGGLVIVNTVLSVAGLILISKGYFDTLPRELEEAAYIDGAGGFIIFWRIILPLVKPILGVVAVQSFVLAYNEYAIANVVMAGGFKTMPLSVGLRSMFEGQYGINWPRYCAAALLGSIPMAVVFFSLQRYLLSGLTDGGVKE